MQLRQHRIWLYAIGGSLAIHAVLAAGLFLPHFDLLGGFRAIAAFARQSKATTLILAYEESGQLKPSVPETTSAMPEAAIRERLAEEINDAQKLSPAELAARLRNQQNSLNRIPSNHFDEIITSLNHLLPAADFSIALRTNDEGTREYYFTYTNANGELQELVFDEDDRKAGGFLHFAEDPRLAPLLRFVLPIADSHTNIPLRNPAQKPR